MKFRYVKPEDVTSPKGVVEFIETLYDGGAGDEAESYSVARLRWNKQPCLGIRWNATDVEMADPKKNNGVCKGHPISRGYPMWFILPEKIGDKIEDVLKTL